MRVKVYLHLYKKLWSVVALEGEHKGRVMADVTHVTLANCRFVVSEKQRQTMLRTHVRKVHAWVIGELIENLPVRGIEFTYNPYRCGWFHARGDVNHRLDTAQRVYFADNKAYTEEVIEWHSRLPPST